MLRSKQEQGGQWHTRRVGWEPARFIFSQLQNQGKLLRLMRLCWCEPEGTESLSLGFVI